MIILYDFQGTKLKDLSFGRVRLGGTTEMSIYVKNEGRFPLIDIEFQANNKDVEILSAPKNLRAGEKEELKLKWSPKVDSEFGLKCTIDWKADELRGEE